ncbi:hypothetical protein AW114_11735 [Escherichia coli]|nr:hypothetical protein AW094_25670 [Escherichia coli]OTD44682.1 hypothetical protein AW098_25610 [Escherichia coli]OTE37926.1 hypothetical protein AW114_11735 [Escherichia coli]
MSGLLSLLWSNRFVICRRHVVCRNVLRLAGELSIVRVLNDFQLLSILCVFCMRGFPPPPTDHLRLYATVPRTTMY